jgi:hypothetical protein
MSTLFKVENLQAASERDVVVNACTEDIDGTPMMHDAGCTYLETQRQRIRQ